MRLPSRRASSSALLTWMRRRIRASTTSSSACQKQDAKIGQIYEGTSNLQLQTIARQLLSP
jgi:alkylation response protein AidB-like acyl-CoA dehydrogenase